MFEKTSLVPFKGEELRPFFNRSFGLLDELTNEFETFWRRPFFAGRMRRFEAGPTWMPTFDVYQLDNWLVVKADLPGLKKQDVHITFEDGALVFSGERKEDKEIEKESFYRAECSYGAFYRRLPLSFMVDPAKIEAKFTDGVLEVRVPMPAEERPKALPIPVN
ncbi:MAG TPA: Hsp20/alpha crystallin family protein [Thermoanaerobaculia bacterium]